MIMYKKIAVTSTTCEGSF